MQYLDYFINSCFILDILINFFSAYYDSELEIIDIHRVSENIVHLLCLRLSPRSIYTHGFS